MLEAMRIISFMPMHMGIMVPMSRILWQVRCLWVQILPWKRKMLLQLRRGCVLWLEIGLPRPISTLHLAVLVQKIQMFGLPMEPLAARVSLT